jgi:high-affinity Fe2+/Pb2+ permease
LREAVEAVMIVQSIVQYLPTKDEGAVDVVVVSAAVTSPATQSGNRTISK